MRRFIPVAISIAALCGCASAKNNTQRPQRSYWESVGDGVIDPHAAFGSVSGIWVHPPQQAQLTPNASVP